MKLLCPTDFSKPAAEAADVAAALAAKQNLALQLVYCAAEWVAAAELPLTDPHDEVAPHHLAAEAKRLAATGTEVKTTVLRGTVNREIAAAAREDTEMIVMGSTGKGAAERWLIGSVAERVAESATVPTLVVRRAEPLLAWLRGDRPLRVLCGVDFTVSADAAIAAVKQLMKLGAIQLEAAYVARAEAAGVDSPLVTGEPSSEEVISLERDVWERLRDALGELPMQVHVRSAFGSSPFELVRMADDLEADLVVVGAHQQHGIKRLAGPSFSRGVLHHASTNVLCVPLASYKPEFRPVKVGRVLVATDFSTDGNEAIRHACGLLPAGGGLRILHVCGRPSTGIDPLVAARVYFDKSLETSKAVTEAEQRMQGLVPPQLATSGITLTTEAVDHDDVPAAICEAAERFGADVICMASRGHSPVAAALLGSTVQRVIALSHRPVFVVTPPPL